MFISKYIINLATRRTLELALEHIEQSKVSHPFLGSCALITNTHLSLTRSLSKTDEKGRQRANSIGERLEGSILRNRRETYKGTYKDKYSGDGSYPIKGYGVVYHYSSGESDYFKFCTPEQLRARLNEQRAQRSYMREANLYHGIDGQQRRLFVKAQLDQFNS